MNSDVNREAIAVPDKSDDYLSKQRVDELPIGGEFGPDDVTRDDSEWEIIEIPADALAIDDDKDRVVVATKPRTLTEPQTEEAPRADLTERQADVRDNLTARHHDTQSQPAVGGAQASPTQGRMSFRTALNTPRDGVIRVPANGSGARAAKARVLARLSPSARAEMEQRVDTFGPRADDVDWIIRDAADRLNEAAERVERMLDQADRTLIERDARMVANMQTFGKLTADTETRIRAAIREIGDSNDGLGAKLLERFATMTDVIKDLTQHSLQENTKEAFLKGGKLASDVLTDDAKKKLTDALKSAAKIVNLVVIERRWLPWLIAAFAIADFAILFFAVVWPHIAPASQPVVMKPRH